ncbi:MAG TPA: Calx-beta domain-containing protein [Pyrinomonadaceae bacterium]|nr:Calx-beta domain-containing protein [Pyrinomonadaceae bacterium]
MFSLTRPSIRTTISAFTRTPRFMLITFGFVLALGGVAISQSPNLRERLGLIAASKPAVSQPPALQEGANKRIDLLKMAGINRATPQPSLFSPLAPIVSATKSDSLFTDVDGDLQADPGDTLKYTVNINSIGGDATGVTFTDTVDPNTAFVPGSLRATPVAVDDSYSATGNVRISVAAPGVLGNDFTGVPNATITAPPSTSANGGDVSLAADGSFTYNPPAGFEGADSFTYTLTNSEGSNSATVTINVSGMIWFINNNAAACTTLAAGCGRLTNPFSSLSAFAALNNGAGNNPAANDNIFVYESASDYVGPVTLLNGQKFIGQDSTASLSSITGITPPPESDPLPAMNSGNGTIVNITNGNAITVASGNTLRGFTGGNSTTDISGSGFGTLTISDVTLNGTGEALNLTNGTLAATFVSISSSNSATTGVTLSNVAGSLTSPTTTITNPTGIGISVGTSSATLDFGSTTSSSSGAAGVSLLTNTGAISFSALNISPDANQRGLLATDNSNTITSTSGAISNTGATAVEITRGSGTTPLALSLTSVSSSGGAGNGIILANTSGSFTIVGTGTAASGGTIANKTGADGSTTQGSGIFLNNAQNVSLDRMQLNDFQNFAIRGTSVTGFTLNNSTISGLNGTTEAAGSEEGGIRFTNLLGSASILNSTISGSYSTHVRVQNTSGVLNRITIDNSTLGALNDNSTHGGSSIVFDATTGATLNFTLSNSTLTGSRSSMLSATQHGGSHMDAVVLQNKLQNADAFILSGAGGILLQGGDLGVADLTFNISCNKISTSATGGAKGAAINIFKATTTTSGSFVGTVGGNAIGVIGQTLSGASNSAPALWIQDHGAGTFTTLVQNNNIVEYGEEAIDLARTQGSSTLNASVFGNTVTPNADNAFAGVTIEQGALGSDTGAMNLVMGNATAASPQRNDFSNGDPFDFADIEILRASSSSTVLNLSRNGSAAATIEGVIQDDNIGGAANAVFIPTTGNMNLVNPLPTLPPAVGGCVTPASLISMGDNPPKSLSQEASAPVDDILFATNLKDAETSNVANGLASEELNRALLAAIERWRDAGISADDLARLQSVSFAVEDLPEGQLAATLSTTVKIDETAAGYGWYSDWTPMEDSEFDVAVPNRELQTTETSPAAGHMDLLTVVMRELGVVYRQGKTRLMSKQLEPLMQNTLSPAVRRLPDSRTIQLPSSKGKASGMNRSNRGGSNVSQLRKDSASTATTVSTSPRTAGNVATNRSAKPASNRNSKLMHHAPRNAPTLSSMLADVMLSIGTLPAGETVTITFNVTVNDPFTGATPQVSNQGTVSGSNFADVLTDDPTVGGTADPTVTPIDLPNVSIAVSPTSVAEDGATNLVYTFTRNGSTANALTANFSIGGTASFGASPNDYTQTGAATFSPPSGTVTFGPGNSTATVTVNPETDTTVEPDETVVLTVTSGIGYVVGAPSSASGTITNDDTDVSVAVSPASVAEDGASNLVYTFTRAGVTTTALTVNFSIALGGSNAVFPADYSQSGATTFAPPVGTVTFSPGSSTATVTVDPNPDLLVEPDETVVFTLTSGTGYNVGSPDSATGTITNDDADVSVTVAPSSATEDGATNLVYTFTRTGFTLVPITVNFSVGGTAVFSQPDYTQTGAATYSDSAGTVVFGAGVTTATVTIDPSADLTVEPDETVVLTVTSGVGYNVGSPDSATGTIINDDTDVSVAVSPGSVSEDGATNLVYTFTRAGVTSTSLTVNFAVGGSATFGASPNDYTQTGATTFTTTSGSVTFAPGNSTATVTVNPETDTTVEPDETVDLTLTAGAGYNVGSPSSASGTIVNDDTDVSIAVAPASVAEDGATNLVYTFTRVGVTSTSLTVNFSVGGTANFGVSPNDYTQTGATSFTSSSGSVTFGPGNSTATVTVNPETDTTIEPDETVILALISGSGYNVSSPSSATGTITNDDADVSVAVSPAAVAEDGATNLVYTFTRTGFTAGALTVNFSVGGTATFGVSPDDYTQTGATTFTTTTGSVTFAPGSPTATVTVDPETDTTAEADETVIITLTAGASYNAVNPTSATGTILNDDTLVSVVVSPSSTAEGGANLVYTFTRTGPTTSAVTANFSVGGTASFPADYTQSGATTFTPPTATVTFAAGSSTKTVTVTPLTDCAVEGSETVVFTVQPGTGYGVGSPSSATGTITNTPDSSAPTITLIPNVNITLWPPNHQYETVAVTDFVASASDNCDASVNLNSVYIQKITSDEVENGNGDGNTLNDIVIAAGCKSAQLRSERDGGADGRVYTITFKVKDATGNFTTATAKVTVRKSPNTPAVDSGTHYTVNSACP